jgi:photosystem II stability/assembly factor-like uncharacterized protein
MRNVLLLCLSAMIILAAASLLPASPVQNQNDLLAQPAERSGRAATSMLLDVENAGKRLVAVGERGHIVYSDDNGTTWNQAAVPVSVTLTAVCFPTPEKGWATGHDGVVLHTADGGKTWVKQLDGSRINNLVLEQVKHLMEGAAGQKQKLERLQFFYNDARKGLEEGPSRPLMALWFRNDREGIVVGSFGMILHTSDGGETWKPILDRIDNPDGLHYYGIVRAGKALFIAGEAGMLFRSDDYGETWKKLESPYQGSFFGIAGNTAGNDVVAFGLRGTVVLSNDGGRTWKTATSPTGATLSAGRYLSDGSLWLAGYDGTVLKSVNDGKSFTAIPVRFPGCAALAETSDKNVMLAGSAGLKRVAMVPSDSEKEKK